MDRTAMLLDFIRLLYPHGMYAREWDIAAEILRVDSSRRATDEELHEAILARIAEDVRVGFK